MYHHRGWLFYILYAHSRQNGRYFALRVRILRSRLRARSRTLRGSARIAYHRQFRNLTSYIPRGACVSPPRARVYKPVFDILRAIANYTVGTYASDRSSTWSLALNFEVQKFAEPAGDLCMILNFKRGRENFWQNLSSTVWREFRSTRSFIWRTKILIKKVVMPYSWDFRCTIFINIAVNACIELPTISHNSLSYHNTIWHFLVYIYRFEFIYTQWFRAAFASQLQLF